MMFVRSTGVTDDLTQQKSIFFVMLFVATAVCGFELQ